MESVIIWVHSARANDSGLLELDCRPLEGEVHVDDVFVAESDDATEVVVRGIEVYRRRIELLWLGYVGTLYCDTIHGGPLTVPVRMTLKSRKKSI